MKKIILFYLFSFLIGINTTASAKDQPLKILFFHSPRCHACHQIKDNFLPPILGKYKNKIEIIDYDINQPENFNYLLECEEKLGISQERGSIPKIFIEETALIGATQIEEKLEGIILKKISHQKKSLFFRPRREIQIPERIVDLFKTFTVGTVCWAGLTDGINPCAFTTLIFFLSFLSFSGYRKREVFYLGTFFILSVFLTYFLLGFGVFKFIVKLKIYSISVQIFYYAVITLVFILGTFSFYDFLRFQKTKNFEGIKLKLPQSIKWRIQSLIGKGYRQEGQNKEKRTSPLKLIFLSLVIGFMVSIFESVCTGQVYLPTITFITRVPALRIKAIIYLLLYNLMFIIPLLVIFALALFGFTSESFTRFSSRHLAKIKLAQAVFFFSLFFLLLYLR